jgi:hypothetical protein
MSMDKKTKSNSKNTKSIKSKATAPAKKTSTKKATAPAKKTSTKYDDKINTKDSVPAENVTDNSSQQTSSDTIKS